MNQTLASNRTMARQQGFSLPELMMVIAIASAVIGVAALGVGSMVRAQRAKSASFDLYSSLSLARSEAIKRGYPVTITRVGSNWTEGWSITASSSTGTTTEIFRSNAVSGVTITAVNCSDDTAVTSLVFSNSGRLASGTPRPCFQIKTASSSDYSRCIKLELSGSPRTTRGACS